MKHQRGRAPETHGDETTKWRVWFPKESESLGLNAGHSITSL